MTGASGYAFKSKMCTSYSVSIVVNTFDMIIGAVAAHELGHW